MSMNITYQLGKYQSDVDTGLQQLATDNILARIWEHDHTVWKSEPMEISNRLGWLRIAEVMRSEIGHMQTLKETLLTEGYTDVLLLGMGGSSLAPEVFSHTFKNTSGLRLQILDSTDPDMVRACEQNLDLSKTLCIVATKSGGTTETLSAFKYFYNRASKAVGKKKVGAQFVAITDPGSKLVDIAKQYKFREIFLNEPNIGGRYSALSFFGLLPATLCGVQLPRLIANASDMSAACGPQTQAQNNPAAVLGAVLGRFANSGMDKITFSASPAIADFPNWVEQLVAESTGKEGKGILPVVAEALGKPKAYGDDRLFVHIQVGDDPTHRAALKALADVGYPVVRIHLASIYDLGGQFLLWELATAVAGYFLQINPFDQPNVESAKALARQMVTAYTENGELPAGEETIPSAAALTEFLSQSNPGDYVALQAYLHPTPEVEAALTELRLEIRDTYKVATTLGFGPRFLHSTGQLHKGDRGNGLFIQLISDAAKDIPIPDEAGRAASAMSFDTLKKSQALGDAQALRDAERRVIVFPVGSAPAELILALRSQ
ncbi:MAG: glucose-6-phosphate isomerase [Anaerolineales bacterium]|nr:glucose-6-phosphate isomerase [Anaerolineales bacterium]